MYIVAIANICTGKAAQRGRNCTSSWDCTETLARWDQSDSGTDARHNQLGPYYIESKPLKHFHARIWAKHALFYCSESRPRSCSCPAIRSFFGNHFIPGQSISSPPFFRALFQVLQLMSALSFGSRSCSIPMSVIDFKIDTNKLLAILKTILPEF